MFTSDSQHPPRSKHAVYLGGDVKNQTKQRKKEVIEYWQSYIHSAHIRSKTVAHDNPLIMLYLGSIGMDRVISESCL